MVCISTAAGRGMKSTNRDMADSTFFWGVAKTYQYGVGVAAVSWDSVKPELKKRIDKKTTAIADKIKKNAGCIKPGIKTRAFFHVMRLMQKSGWNEADRSYWKEKGWTEKKRPWKT